MGTDVQTIQKEVRDFASTIPTEITTAKGLQEAAGLFVSIRKKRKEAEAWFNEKFIDPAKALLKSHQNEARLTIQPLVDAETVLNKAMVAYRQQEAERTRKEQEKLNAKYEKKVEKALAQGREVEEVAPPVVVQAPATSTKTDDGQLIFKKVKKLICVDEGLTPDVFCVITRSPNKKMIDAALRAGQAVPGWRLEEVEELATR